MRAPAVSVLLPVRDGARWLSESLASLSQQTFADFEVVVVDDGSRDGSAELVESYRDPRVRVVRQEPLGIVAALERARAEARGRLLARMDADDVAASTRLEVQVDALDGEGLGAVGGRIEYVPAARAGARRYAAWLNSLTTVEAAARDVFVECPLPHPTLLARRELVAYRDVPWPEDYDLVLRLWSRGVPFRNVEHTVLRWRERADRLSRVDERYSLAAFVRCKVHHLTRTLARDRRVVVWGAGPVGKAFGRELGPRLAAFVDLDPRKIGKRIYGVPVLAVGDAPRAFAIGAVAGDEARAEIRAATAALGLREGVDFVAVA